MLFAVSFRAAESELAQNPSSRTCDVGTNVKFTEGKKKKSTFPFLPVLIRLLSCPTCLYLVDRHFSFPLPEVVSESCGF